MTELPIPQRFPIASKVLDIIGEVVDRRVTDKNANDETKREIEMKIVDADLRGELAQIDLNKVEAQNQNVWVSGWRPYIGWVGGTGFAVQFVIIPFLGYVYSLFGYEAPPPLELDPILWQVIFGILGIGIGSRTLEKIKGVASK